MSQRSINKLFNYNLNYNQLDLRKDFHLYNVGRGEQGVLLVQPYKNEILPLWKFKTPAFAEKSAKSIFQLFIKYKQNQDFVGMDMARKFLQMGYTRSRRYANHRSGKKYDGPVPQDKKGQSGAHGREILPLDIDEEKADSARVFYGYWKKAEMDMTYSDLKVGWKVLFG